MKVFISPAKTMKSRCEGSWNLTLPQCEEYSKKIVDVIRLMSVEDIMKCMKVNESIAQQTKDKFDSVRFDSEGVPALLAYDGIQYKNMRAMELDDEDIKYANEHIRIISGLYGVLRPLDSIYPYRLELLTKLAIDEHKDLYHFWGSKIYESIIGERDENKKSTIVNLASSEFSKAIASYIDENVDDYITVTFQVQKGERRKVESTASKKARGQMVQYIIKNKLKDKEELKSFAVDGYEYRSDLSSDKEYVFLKQVY